jgi:two-component system response regulator FlrC
MMDMNISQSVSATPVLPNPGITSSKNMITEDKSMVEILKMAENIAASKSTVLITGESGTGKELLTNFIHKNSPRANKNFVAVNCAAIPEGLLESELFGHEKGSFTGAHARTPGKFELANGGTLLLDEISEMHISLQAKLLRVLQEDVIDMVGSRKPIPVNVRVIATTNTDLSVLVKKGQFRKDLFYRLNVIPIRIPSLRNRKKDIPKLAHFFVNKFCARDSINVKSIDTTAIDKLVSWNWPGNVRELENTIERAVLLSDGQKILRNDIQINESENFAESMHLPVGSRLRDVEQQLIIQTLESHGGNRTHAARTLGISLRTLRNKISEYRAAGIQID